MAKSPRSSASLTPQPLYKRAEAEMTSRIARREWVPGDQLPNEFELAKEFNVSQGTIRKALVAMERRGLLMRSPGRGTTVSKTTQEAALYTFFRMRDASGALVVPQTAQETLALRAPDPAEQAALGKRCTRIAALRRVRTNDGRPFVVEDIRLDAALCAGIEDDLPLPNSLYPYLHDRFGIAVMRVDERIAADQADSDLAAALDIAPGTPLLRVERAAFDLADAVVELRSSLYRTDFAQYQITLNRSESLKNID